MSANRLSNVRLMVSVKTSVPARNATPSVTDSAVLTSRSFLAKMVRSASLNIVDRPVSRRDA